MKSLQSVQCCYRSSVFVWRQLSCINTRVYLVTWRRHSYCCRKYNMWVRTVLTRLMMSWGRWKRSCFTVWNTSTSCSSFKRSHIQLMVTNSPLCVSPSLQRYINRAFVSSSAVKMDYAKSYKLVKMLSVCLSVCIRMLNRVTQIVTAAHRDL